MLSSIKNRFVIILIIFSFSAIVCSIPGYILYANIKTLIVEELGRNAENVAISVAELVEQDIDSYQELFEIEDYSEGTYDEVYYQKMLTIFYNLRTQTGADYIYTEKMIDDATIVYLIDGEDQESEFFSPIGSEDVMYELERQAFVEGIPVATSIETYPVWGECLSGFAPIINHETDEIIGVVGVDFSLSYVQGLITSVRIVIAIGLMCLTGLATYVLYQLVNIRSEALDKDYLTSLYSKRYQDLKLRKALREAKFRNNPLSLVMLDVDYFKEINDNYGHNTGDKVLKAVAEVILYNTRNIDICSRYGGDEFLIIFPNTTPKEAEAISEKIKQNILKISLPEELEMQISVSIGLSEWNRVCDAEELIIQADKAMYVSKNTGKNKITIYK
ncbi:MAG: diguanylate cyclase [Firmicutes bacterium]|nr:diguanylate cyclase [Bacillota bacterium]